MATLALPVERRAFRYRFHPGTGWAARLLLLGLLAGLIPSGRAGPMASPPTCQVSGPSLVCAWIENTYVAITDSTNAAFQWSLLSNTAGAFIVGPSNSASVQVNAGADSGTYTLRIALTQAPKFSASAEQVVTVQARTTASPLGSVTTCLGEGAVFSALPAGAGPFLYRWTRNGVELSGQTNSTLVLPSVGMADAGLYGVEITGACNSVTNFGTLTVNPPPVCEIAGPQQVCPNTAGNLFTGPPGMSVYQWSVEGSGIIVGGADRADVDVNTGGAGFITLNLLVIDPNGCRATCQRIIPVADPLPPSLICPANCVTNTAPGQCARTVSFEVLATDDCPVTVLCSPPSGSAFPKGTTVVTCTATDAGGNRQSGSFTVTVNDTEKPVLTIPEDLVTNTAPGQCQAVVTYEASVTDNCPGVTLRCAPVSGSRFSKGVTTVLCTARDAAGNMQSGAFHVTVIDLEKPVITCPANVATNTDPGQGGAYVAYATPVADNCAAGLVVSCLPPSGAFFPAGTTPVNCSATDLAGNTDTCGFLVTVNDVEPPTLACPADMDVDTDPALGGAVVTYTAAAADNCPGFTLLCQPESGTSFLIGMTRVECTATDATGNSNVCSFLVNVRATNTTATPLTSLTVCPGEPAVFSTTVSGTGPFRFRWSKDDVLLPDQTNSSLAFPAVTSAEAGLYSVEVSGALNTVTNTGTLTVRASASLTPLVAMTRCAGERATFTARASGTGPFRYAWRKDGVELPGATNGTWTIPAVNPSHAGVYSVEVSGPCNTAASSARLVVNLPATITPLTNQVRCLCDSAVFTTTVSGTGPFTCVWRKDGVVLPGETRSSLILPFLRLESAGSYMVEVAGACNTVSNCATLTIRHPENPATFSYFDSILLNDLNRATPYPSTIAVQCVPGLITHLAVTLHNLSHPYPDDLDILLVGPAGQAVVLMSDAGGGYPLNGADLTFDDGGAMDLPDSEPLYPDTYRPANFDDDADPFVLPAPVLPYATNLSVFNGTNPNGPWMLYVVDDFRLDQGTLGGWSLTMAWDGPPPPRLSGFRRLADGRFQITVQGHPGKAIVIEASTDMQEWGAISTNVLGSATANFIDPTSANRPQKFYRVGGCP